MKFKRKYIYQDVKKTGKNYFKSMTEEQYKNIKKK